MILDRWHPPEGLWPEIRSPEETHGTPEMALLLCSQETEQLGRGGDKTHHPIWGEYACQAPGGLNCSDLGRTQNAGPTESVSFWSTREPEPEWLRPGKYMQLRAHLRQLPGRATWSLSTHVPAQERASSPSASLFYSGPQQVG